MQSPVQLDWRIDCFHWKSLNACLKKERKHQPIDNQELLKLIWGNSRTAKRSGFDFISGGKKEIRTGNGNKGRKRGRTLGHQMPPRRIQRLVRAPGDIRAVRSTRAVLVDIRWAKLSLPVQPGIRVHIAPPPVLRQVIHFAHAHQLGKLTCAHREFRMSV